MKGTTTRLTLAIAMVLASTGCGPKEETNKPERRVEPRRTEPTGPQEKLMTPETMPKVMAVFKSQTGELERCYNDFVSKTGNTKLKGTIVLAARIGVTPRPLKVWFLKTTFTQKELNDCFLRKVSKWLFPTWGGWQDVSFPRLLLEEL